MDRKGRVEYDIDSTESVSEAVVRAVSALDGREPGSIEPLASVVDTDALDTLFAARKDGEPRPGGRVSFVWEHCCVTVDNGEYLTVRPLRIRPRATSDGETDFADAR